MAEGISGKTIKNGDLAALNSVFGWAVENKRLTTNPAHGLTVRVPRRKVERERGFTDHEAMTILRTALTYSKAERESPGLAAAKTWVPWLCAFTGARVTEVTALRKQDFRSEGTVPVVRIFGTKGGEYRDVPLHPQLVDIGLLTFVQSAGAGPLFYNEKGSTCRATRKTGPLAT